MLVSLNWLKQYVDYGDLSAEQLAERITRSGIEVDGIHYLSKQLENVVVGYVMESDPHPNADQLSLCQVDVGNEKLQIACGAANVAKGQKVAVAKPGAVLPGDFKIERVKLRGLDSEGMICSLQELGVDDAYIPDDIADGIFIFPEDVNVGDSVTSLLNLDDVILEFDLTPNRGDSLSMLGVAYEVAAILDLPINLPDETVTMIDEPSANHVEVNVEQPALIPYYGAFIIKDVKIKQSPLWMQNYLMAAGVRPINNVVDITNFVLLEYGQPLHAFDYDRLPAKDIGARLAKDGETIKTLDGKHRTLTDKHIVITSGNEPVALAGVMGGENTEVNDQTTTILLEAAYFDPKSVRQAVLHTGLRSDASQRFEKGVDPNRIYRAGLRACQLLEKYADGKVLKDAVAFDELDRSEKSVNMSTEAINERLGTEITTDEIKHILNKLRFSFTEEDNEFIVNIPTRRQDIAIFEDMVEEVGRIYGYDQLPYTLPGNPSKPGALSRRQKVRRQVNNFLQGAGLMETMTYSLTNKQSVDQLMGPDLRKETYYPVKLAMPLSEDHEYLRLSILPEMLKTASYNRARSLRNIAYYELGSVYLSKEKEIKAQPIEQLRLAGVLTGEWVDHEWQHETKQVDFFVVKGIIEGLFNYLNIDVTFKQSQLRDMHPGRCATLVVNDEEIGLVGQVHPTVAEAYDLKETYVFELNMEYILDVLIIEETYEPIPKYPSVKRDIAFIVNKDVIAGDIQQSIKQIGAPLVKQVDIFDLYVGDQLEDHEKSIAYRLHFQDPEKTLQDAVVDQLYEQIIAQINKTYDAYVRS